MRPRLATLALILLAACSREPGRKRNVSPEAAGPAAPVATPAETRPTAKLRPLAPAADLELMPADQHLVRIALALAGKRPTDAELAAVRTDPNALGGIVDAYLDAPEFGAVIRDMWHEVLLLRVEGRYVLNRLGPLPAGTDSEWVRDVSEEPLRLIEHVVVHDRPFSEVVTADYSLATPLGLAVWGGTALPADPAAPAPAGWQRVAWDSGQQMAGILSSGALWLRHPSNGTNLHRGQANLIADALLCAGFLDRDVPLFNNIDLSDEDVVRRALVTEPGCVSCHQTLDPLASHLFGVQRVANGAIKKAYAGGDECAKPERGMCFPLTEYRPAQAGQWRKKTGRPPNYFGLPSADLRGLAAQISADPRFSMCVARRFYGYFMQVGLDEIPDPTAASLQDAFLASELRVKPLVKAIVLSDDFKAVHARPGSPAEPLVGRKTTRPEQLARLVESLTGFTWTGFPARGQRAARVGEVDLLSNDTYGYRAMAGGVEGIQITEPSFAYSPTRTLVLQTLAAEAAAAVVAADLDAPPARRRLLADITPQTTDEPAVRAQLAALHARVLGESLAPDSPEVTATHALFTAGLGAKQDTTRAWTLVLTALLQDPRVAFH